MNGWSTFISRAAFNSLEIMLSRPTGLTLVQLKFSHGGYKALLAFKQKNVKFGRYHESGLYKLGQTSRTFTRCVFATKCSLKLSDTGQHSSTSASIRQQKP